MSVASALYTLGFPEENRDFVDSLASLENRLRHPAERMYDDDSSDESLTEDEGGNWKLREKKPKEMPGVRSKQQKSQSQAPPKQQHAPPPAVAPTSSTRAKLAEGEPMEGVEEHLGPQKSGQKAVTVVPQAPNAIAGSSKALSAHAPPRRLSPVLVASTSHAKSSSSRTLHIPKSPPLPTELVTAGPVVSTSGLGGRAPAPKGVGRSADNDSDIEIIEDVSPPPKKKVVSPKPSPSVKTSTKKRSSETASTSKSRASPKKKRKPLKPLKELVALDKKLKAKGIQDKWKTISNYIDRLEGLVEDAAPVQDTLAGCRVLMVHPDIRKDRSEHNKIDEYTVHRLGLLAGAGAALVKPEDFLAPPLGSKPTAGPWTTHIMIPEIPGFPAPRFSRVLECVGPKGIQIEELGDCVHVVREEWMAASMDARAYRYPTPDPTDYYLRDDPRQQQTSPTKKKGGRPSTDDKGKGKAGDSDTENEREHEMEADEERSMEAERDANVSPFGLQDYPAGERPPAGYFQPDAAVKGNHPSADTTSASDPIVDPTPSDKRDGAAFSLEGLEEQMKYIEEQGADQVDNEMDMVEKEIDIVFLQNNPGARPIPQNKVEYKSHYEYTSLEAVDVRESDYETEEEEEAEISRRSKTKTTPPTHGVYKRGKKDRYYRKNAGYACDRGSTNRPTVSPNEGTAKILDQLSEVNIQDPWRSRGYKQAAGSLRNCPHYIKTYKQAIALDKVGDSIATKIVEIVQTGTHRKLSMQTNRDRSIAAFTLIYGVGRNVAAQLYDRGARTVQDLIDHADYYDLTDSQKLGLKHYEDLKQRIPREEVAQVHQYAVDIAKEIDPKLEVYCMGSYRRGEATCGDIDLLVTRSTEDGKDHTGMIKKLWDGLVKLGVARHSLSSSDDWNALDAKFNALCAVPNGIVRRLDILGCPYDEVPASLCYFTGDNFFNRSMRLKARHLGYRLNQRGLYKDVSRGRDGTKLTEGRKIDCKTEKDIFDILNVPWRPPTERRP